MTDLNSDATYQNDFLLGGFSLECSVSLNVRFYEFNQFEWDRLNSVTQVFLPLSAEILNGVLK
jgi:hypothetical protein